MNTGKYKVPIEESKGLAELAYIFPMAELSQLKLTGALTAAARISMRTGYATILAVNVETLSATGQASSASRKLPEIGKFRRQLLAWFAAHKRDLPWRRTKD